MALEVIAEKYAYSGSKRGGSCRRCWKEWSSTLRAAGFDRSTVFGGCCRYHQDRRFFGHQVFFTRVAFAVILKRHNRFESREIERNGEEVVRSKDFVVLSRRQWNVVHLLKCGHSSHPRLL
ncbi:hypothetical protein E8E14_004873 [Neopestalotiopsis sp. 37M]|nr:hypothetical protein E8E14_004873 [Neopestalotiopsis sp. 37M]